jgi:hypothetical protein
MEAISSFLSLLVFGMEVYISMAINRQRSKHKEKKSTELI